MTIEFPLNIYGGFFIMYISVDLFSDIVTFKFAGVLRVPIDTHLQDYHGHDTGLLLHGQ